jgi:hypothetical protein
MDHEILVNQLRDLIEQLQSQQGHLALCMLLGHSFGSNASWNLVVSAEGYNQLSKKNALEHLVSLLRHHLTDDTLPFIERVTILKTTDPFVKTVNHLFQVSEHSAVTVQNTAVLDVSIDAAIILESAKAAELELSTEMA